MLVRSQNKEMLTECTRLYVDALGSVSKHTVSNQDSECLGEYSTREQTIKVLDTFVNSYENFPTRVFNMPQDKEM